MAEFRPFLFNTIEHRGVMSAAFECSKASQNRHRFEKNYQLGFGNITVN